MDTIPIKRERKGYINFRMRKFIYQFIIDNHVEMSHMNLEEKAKFISERIEEKIVDQFWIKDKRKDVAVIVPIRKIA